ncbi:MAG: hypothetical protein QGI51_06220 [Dehalococcoidales bacterium]|nr:hypothetical protein [Dehalococcoidales bacterium]
MTNPELGEAGQAKQRLYLTNRRDWREWLEKNYADCKEIWLVFFKKHTDVPSIPYDDAVEEALCFGWIDNEKYCRKFTPRKSGSVWSESNKTRVERMIGEDG